MAKKKGSSRPAISGSKKVKHTAICLACESEQEAVMILLIGMNKRKVWCCKACHGKGVITHVSRP